MRVRHIIHNSISPTEYYFCSWQSQQDIDEFCSKCPWFDKEDARLGERIVLQVNNEEGNIWYEKFELNWFKQHLQERINITNTIFNEFIKFFQSN